MAQRSSATGQHRKAFAERTASALRSQKLIAFIATRDPARAKAFYRDTLGLNLVSEDQFALVFDAGGTMLRVTPVQQLAAASYIVLGWKVTDIVRTTTELQQAHVAFERYPGMQPDEHVIWNSPGGDRVAWFRDPDGNTLSVTQF